MQPTHCIVARVFVEVADQAAARALVRELATLMQSAGRPVSTQVSEYEKHPEWFECRVVLEGPFPTYQEWFALLDTLGNRWERKTHGDDVASAVMSGEVGAFFSPLVRWANVEVFPLSAIEFPAPPEPEGELP